MKLSFLLALTLFNASVALALDPLPAFTPGARILFQGDSITDGARGRGTDPNHILGHSYVFLIAARFGAAFPEAKLEFLNRGVSGNTVLDLQKRWPAETLALQPDLLSVLIGVNDQGHGVPLDQYEGTYEQLLNEAQSANPRLKLVLCGTFRPPRRTQEGERGRLVCGAEEAAGDCGPAGPGTWRGAGSLPAGLRRGRPAGSGGLLDLGRSPPDVSRTPVDGRRMGARRA